MKARYILILFGLGFFITLAVIVGQRLSSEAMAVMVGVVAGVAASIPTSLIVVWLATRTSVSRAPEPPTARTSLATEPRFNEPRIVVMTAQPPAGAQSYAGYAPTAYPAYAMPPALTPRQFTVIGGAEVMLDAQDAPAEVVWPR